MAMSRKNRIGLLGTLGMVVFVAGAGGWFALSQDRTTDPVTLCRADAPNRVNRIIIVDKTDPLPRLSLSNLKQTIVEQRDQMAVQDRLWIFAMSSDGIDISRPLFSRCRPNAGKDVSSFDADPERVQLRYRESFEKPLDDVLQPLLAPTSAEESPIIETLGRVAASATLAGPGPRHIVFVTDLLQHSAMFSAYGAAWTRRPKPADLGEQLVQNFGRVFGSVDLTILVIDRHEPGTPKQADLRDYWRAALRGAGVMTLAIRNL